MQKFVACLCVPIAAAVALADSSLQLTVDSGALMRLTTDEPSSIGTGQSHKAVGTPHLGY